MDNDQFRDYIARRLAEVQVSLASGDLDEAARRHLARQYETLKSADRMARYSSGREFRRFRRDFERRMARRRG